MYYSWHGDRDPLDPPNEVQESRMPREFRLGSARRFGGKNISESTAASLGDLNLNFEIDGDLANGVVAILEGGFIFYLLIYCTSRIRCMDYPLNLQCILVIY